LRGSKLNPTISLESGGKIAAALFFWQPKHAKDAGKNKKRSSPLPRLPGYATNPPFSPYSQINRQHRL
jgi:hypothetical protein